MRDERDPAAEAERSRAQIEAGGLPVAAERRLRELAEQPGGLFTSDLSVNEFALLRRLEITPLTQVMGSSIFQHGWQNLPYDTWYGYRRNASASGLFAPAFGGMGGRNWGSSGDGGAWSRELTGLSAAFNGARERALDRLLAEARLAGADAVVGVRIQQGGHAFLDPDTVEFTAVGTAVRLPGELRTDEVVITDLSAQEYVQLAAEGYRPVGVVGTTVVMYTASSYGQSVVLGSGNSFFSVAGRANQELPDFTQGFYDARETAVLHLSRQARELGAHGVIGVQFAQHIREREYDDANENKHHDLIVTIHVLGTAITEGHPRLTRPPVTAILPLRRL